MGTGQHAIIKPLLAKASMLLRDNKFEEAKGLYLKAYEIDDNHFVTLLGYGVTLKHLRDFDKAAEVLQKAITQNPNSVDAQFNLGNIFLIQGNIEEALETFNRIILIDSTHNMSHYNIGVCLQKQGHTIEAIKCFRNAIEYGATGTQVFSALGKSLDDIGELEQAYSLYQKAMTQWKGEADLATRYIHCMFMLEKYEQICSLVKSIHKTGTLSPEQTKSILIIYYISTYIRGETHQLASIMEEIKAASVENESKQLLQLEEILTYVQTLSLYKKNHIDLFRSGGKSPKEIFCIGDSRCLSLTHVSGKLNQYPCKMTPLFIPLLKLEHFEESVNRYQSAFQSALKNIKFGSDVFIFSGSEDCLPSSRYFQALYDNSMDIMSLTKDLKTHLLLMIRSVVTATKSKRCQVTFVGVSPFNYKEEEAVDPEYKEKLKTLIQCYNTTLENILRETPFEYVNLYSKCFKGEGEIDEDLFLDSAHLTPKAVAELGLGLTF